MPAIPEKLQTVIERHDDDFDLGNGGGDLPVDKPDTTDPLADAAGTPQVDAPNNDGIDDDFSHLDDDFDTPLEAKANEPGNVRPISRRRQA